MGKVPVEDALAVHVLESFTYLVKVLFHQRFRNDLTLSGENGVEIVLHDLKCQTEYP